MASTNQSYRYREIERLGAGGMATVTLAEDTLLGRSVALKRVYASGDTRDTLRLKREALVGASLNHPNLVYVYDAQVQDDGDVVIVMEYVPGDTLSDLIRARGPIPFDEALPILRGLAAALDAIRARGIVHRDVKPANILLGPEGAVKLADLGVADVADRTRITTAGAIVGSFSYMAPEQLEGAEPDAKMDIYALAALAYELLTGEKARPESNPLALAHAIATQPPPDLRKAWPQAPAAAAVVLQRGMSADPDGRPGTAGELVSRLERAFEPEKLTQPEPRPTTVPAGAASRPPGPGPIRKPSFEPSPAGRRTTRSRLAPALVALAALVAAGLVIATLSSGGNGRPNGPSSGQASAARTAGSTGSRAASPPKASTSPPAAASSGQAQASAPSSAAAPATALNAGGAAAAGSGAGASNASGAAAATPSGAVERFYEAAAAHQYATAWALADPNMRNQVGGFAAFENQMSSVRSITFHRAQVIDGTGTASATVGLQTTSVQIGRTQQCSGTARTVRSGGAWLLDGISISCS